MSAVGSILTNQGALEALQSIDNTSTLNNTLEGEISSGLSISSPASNPAGYITAQGFTSQLNGLTQAISNANQASPCCRLRKARCSSKLASCSS